MRGGPLTDARGANVTVEECLRALEALQVFGDRRLSKSSGIVSGRGDEPRGRRPLNPLGLRTARSRL